MKHRCSWAHKNPLEIDYHDNEWGVPLHNDQKLFEFIILEGAQAGLSWSTILNKRKNYRIAFDQFDVSKVARYDESKIQQLLTNTGIVRNKLKIRAAISNAQHFIEIQNTFGSFDQYIWAFTEGITIQNQWSNASEVPATSLISDKMSRELKKMGFKFVGSTICYAFMQAIGMVNDHTTDCFRHQEVQLL